MNNITLIGRLTREPELRYTPQQLAVAKFSLAIDRGRDNKGESKGTDFTCITVLESKQKTAPEIQYIQWMLSRNE